MDHELILRRGVVSWWAFSAVSSLSTKVPTLAVLFLLPLAIFLYSSSTVLKSRSHILTNGLGATYGFALYHTTAIFMQRWSPLVKTLCMTCPALAVVFIGPFEPQTQLIYSQMLLEAVVKRLVELVVAAREVGNPVLRYILLMLSGLSLLVMVNTLSMVGLIYDFRQDGYFRIQLFLRRLRLKLRARFAHIRKRYVGDVLLAPGKTYTHKSLEDSSGTIRLLKLLKRRPFGEIRCELVEVKLESAPVYEAISYTWGAAGETEMIYIGDLVFSVSTTVSEVLYHLSSYNTERNLWIDSICINQTDNEEKGSQVSMMKRIYRRSSKVIIWLEGVKNPRNVRVMLAGICHNMVLGSEESTVDLVRKYSEEWAHAGWSDLLNLFNNPWFFRVWVIQEIASASNAEVLASGTPMQWEHLFLFASELVNNPALNSILRCSSFPGVEQGALTGLKHANLMAGFKNQSIEPDTEGQSGPNLSVLLDLCSGFRATDPRDKIFALLGLLSAKENIIRPDYFKTTAQVYTETAQCMLSGKCTNIFSFMGIGYARTITDLPSWVPDWSSMIIGSPEVQNFSLIQDAARYRASGYSSQLDLSFAETGRYLALRIRGCHVDTIRHLGPVSNYTPHRDGRGGTQDENIDALARHIGARNISKQFAAQPYPTGQPLDEAFWRCLIGDTQFYRPAPDELGEYLEIWERYVGLLAQVPDSADRAVKEAHFAEHLGLQEEGDGDVLELFFRRAGFWNSARMMCCIGRRFCVTEAGYMAMVPPGTAEGDMVALLCGVDIPQILRGNSTADGGSGSGHRLVGEAYVHGLMDGEMMAGVGEADVEYFSLI